MAEFVTTAQTDVANGSWSTGDSYELYAADRWNEGYFRINELGHVSVHPDPDSDHAIDLKQLVDNLEKRDLGLPLLVRFDDILKHRIDRIQNAFATAIKDCDYNGDYRFVYPIKVNQQRHIVEQVLQYGKCHGFGVEAGSKPELLAVMALVDDEQTPIICNGFKDAEYIEGVVLAKKMGKNIIPVVESFAELELLVKAAEEHGVHPAIGLRVKLASRGAGRWENSAGYQSKFGLTAGRVLDALAYLHERGMGDCLTLLHFHMGSQVNDIQQVKKAIVEATRVYVELVQAGAGLKYIDVGGGLGVGYDDASTNYALQEYANDVVYYVREVCEQFGVDHPTIISESGRAVTAHHSVLVFNVLGTTEHNAGALPIRPNGPGLERVPGPLRRLFEIQATIDSKSVIESFHDAELALDEMLSSFSLGYCSLVHRAAAERLYYDVCRQTQEIASAMDEMPEQLAHLESKLAPTYFCNLSIFQSLPDAWAIEQLFPIMPIHRLDQEPTSRGILADITCDSDGKLCNFIDHAGTRPTLPLHQPNGQSYYLGAFLVGAYQEILGDLHNLFGDTNAVHVKMDDKGKPVIDEIVEGDTVSDVLQYVQFSSRELKRAMRRRIEEAVSDERLTLEEAAVLRRFYESGLEGYTYLE